MINSFFLLKSDEVDLKELTPFYKSMITAWRKTFIIHKDILQPEDWIMGEPLFHYPLIRVRIIVKFIPNTGVYFSYDMNF